MPLQPMFFLIQQAVEFSNESVEFFRVWLGGDLRRQLHQSFSFLALHQIIPLADRRQSRPMNTLDISETIKRVQAETDSAAGASSGIRGI